MRADGKDCPSSYAVGEKVAIGLKTIPGASGTCKNKVEIRVRVRVRVRAWLGLGLGLRLRLRLGLG